MNKERVMGLHLRAMCTSFSILVERGGESVQKVGRVDV